MRSRVIGFFKLLNSAGHVFSYGIQLKAAGVTPLAQLMVQAVLFVMGTFLMSLVPIRPLNLDNDKVHYVPVGGTLQDDDDDDDG